MLDFNIVMPTRMISGEGKVIEIKKLLASAGVKKPIVVTDKPLMETGLVDQLLNIFRDEQIEYLLFDEVKANPDESVISQALSMIEGHDCDSVVAMGGGSSIDAAKAVAAMATNDGHILDYEGVGKLVHRPLPLFAIPTTAGTGSECTPSTVITNSESHFKTAIISDYLYPSAAILDPNLVMQLPRAITAATGMDAMTHSIESFVSKQANPYSSALALGCIETITHTLPICYQKGDDREARSRMLTASFMAGVAFSQSRLGNVHAISHTLGGIFDIPHGLANAVLLPYVMVFNLEARPDLFKRIAEAMGVATAGMSEREAGYEAVRKVVALNRELDIPLDIQSIGADLGSLDAMINDAMRSGNVLVNPRETGREDIRNIIENAYHGRGLNI